jgi:hypothetical protein
MKPSQDGGSFASSANNPNERISSSGNQQAPKRPQQEMSALDRLKQIQSNFKRQWNGIDCTISGRVGTSNFVNKKRTFIIPETYTEEEER